MDIKPEEIKQLREELKLTREQFAQVLSVSYKTVSRWESKGIKSISNSSSDKLIQLLKIVSTSKGSSVIKDILKSTPGIAGVACVATLIPILEPILATSGFFAPTILSAIKKLFKDNKNNND